MLVRWRGVMNAFSSVLEVAISSLLVALDGVGHFRRCPH